MNNPSEKALQIAAQCWCDEDTGNITMNVSLATAFAKRLDNNYSAIAELTERNIKLQSRNTALIEALKLALSFAPKGPVSPGLCPMFYHTLNYEDDCKLQGRIDAARKLLEEIE